MSEQRGGSLNVPILLAVGGACVLTFTPYEALGWFLVALGGFFVAFAVAALLLVVVGMRSFAKHPRDIQVHLDGRLLDTKTRTRRRVRR